MVELAFARKHIEIKHAERLTGCGIGYEIKLKIIDPLVRRSDLFKLQAENALINIEHPVEHFLEREIRTQGFLIDGVFLLIPLVTVVAPVPNLDLCVGIIRIGGFQLL